MRSQAVPIVLASSNVAWRRASNRSCAKLIVRARVNAISPSMPVVRVETLEVSLSGSGAARTTSAAEPETDLAQQRQQGNHKEPEDPDAEIDHLLQSAYDHGLVGETRVT